MDSIKLLLAGILSLIILPVWAQSDSSNTAIEEDSIVYIDDSPLVISKSVSYEEVVYKNWFLEINGYSFKHSNFHNLCEECGEYKNEIQKSLKPFYGYGGGITIFNVGQKRRIIYSGGFSYSLFREKFSHLNSDSSSVISQNNYYGYVDLNLGVGYWLMRKKKHFSLVINTSVIGSTLILKHGSTLGYHDLSILNIKEVSRDADLVLGGRLGLKIMALNDKRLKVYIEPFSRVNFTSVLKYSNNYYLRRWAVGLGFGLIYAL